MVDPYTYVPKPTDVAGVGQQMPQMPWFLVNTSTAAVEPYTYVAKPTS